MKLTSLSALIYGIAFIGTILHGWVLSILWGWFIVPIFNAPALTIPYAIGMSIIVHMFTTKTTSKISEQEYLNLAVLSIVSTLIALGFAWIVHLFV